MIEGKEDRMDTDETMREELCKDIEWLRDVMISVATGGARIESVNREYIDRQAMVTSSLGKLGIADPNPYGTLWEWYGKWSSGDLPTYQSRRNYINGLFTSLLKVVRETGSTAEIRPSAEPTGWVRVDRNLGEARLQLEHARTEEQFQAIGLLCRETLISLAQEIYDRERHPSLDGVTPSETDARRMLEAYMVAELGGNTNEATRYHAKAALRLANDLTHKRTAEFKEAAMCVEATGSVVNMIAIISGRRDPA